MGKKIILPGDRPPGLGLLIPTEAAPVYVCRVPVGDGKTCGAKFYKGQEAKITGHINRCSRQHRDAIAANSPKVTMPLFYDPEQWDPEYEKFMRDVGHRMRAEGRDEQRRGEH